MSTTDALPEPCIGNDSLCPCQDGDACHYRDTPTTKGWPTSTWLVQHPLKSGNVEVMPVANHRAALAAQAEKHAAELAELQAQVNGLQRTVRGTNTLLDSNRDRVDALRAERDALLPDAQAWRDMMTMIDKATGTGGKG